MRILYVEDNLALREIVGMAIEGQGRTVVCCSTAEEALELDGREPFDVLVSDASLPGLSGTELARRILAKDPERCVVICSGYELGHYPSGWGPNVSTLRKPFELEDLEATLDAARDTVSRRNGRSG